jgi:hypothetical protein
MWKGRNPNPEVRQTEAKPERILSTDVLHRMMEFGHFCIETAKERLLIMQM